MRTFEEKKVDLEIKTTQKVRKTKYEKHLKKLRIYAILEKIVWHLLHD